VNLKGLVHRELGEGLTEVELAFAVGVSSRMIADILVDELPQDPAIIREETPTAEASSTSVNPSPSSR